MPGVKANTQAKGKEKEKVGGGGAAGIKARLGGGETRDCAMCVGTNPPARNRRGGGDATASTARWRLTSPPRRYVRAWRSTHACTPHHQLTAARSSLTSARRRHSSKRLVARARCQLHLPRAPA